MQRDRARVWIYRLAVAAVFAAFAMGALHRVASPWQWGHNGYNGAAFAQAARNSLRFGIVGQAQYHTGLEKPQSWAIYTHHPLMLHAHLVALFALLGDAEWVGRLVPALYSIFNIVLIFVIARRLGGPAMALLSAVLYALLPINLVFANMIDHEQGGIFWCLLCVYSYILWLRGYRVRHLILALASITAAVQFDWPGYYIAFFIVLHSLVTGIVRHRGVLRWRPEYTWVAVFSVVVLANFVGFFTWIQVKQGALGGMHESFVHRTSVPPGYLDWVWMHLMDLYGYRPLALTLAWAILTVVRVARGRSDDLDLVVLLFMLAQLIHSSVFRQAGLYHSYWTIWMGPAVAIGGARFLTWLYPHLAAACRRVLTSIGGRSGTLGVVRTVPPLLAASLLAVVLVPQARFSFWQLMWGYATGSASYVPAYDDHYADITWSRTLGNRYDREKVRFIIDPSVQARIEFLYYLDSPHSWIPVNALTDHGGLEGLQRVVLVDLKQSTARADVARYVQDRRVLVWDRRFVAIELDARQGGTHGFVSRAVPMTFWHRWLVNPWRPDVTWHEDPDPGAVANLFDTSVQVTLEPIRGSPGGEARAWDCPRGQVMGALAAVIRNSELHGRILGALRPFCRPVSWQDGGRSAQGEEWGGPWQGGWWGVSEMKVACQEGDVPVGARIHLVKGRFVAGVALLCTTLERLEDRQSFIQATPYETSVAGRVTGKGTRLRCPAGSVVWGLRARLGSLVDAAGISCVALDAPFVDNPPTPLGQTPWEWP